MPIATTTSATRRRMIVSGRCAWGRGGGGEGGGAGAGGGGGGRWGAGVGGGGDGAGARSGEQHPRRAPAGLSLLPVAPDRAGGGHHVVEQVRRGDRGAWRAEHADL